MRKEYVIIFISIVVLLLIIYTLFFSNKKYEIYFDNNATTHIYPEVAKKMYNLELSSFGNPSSPYELGRESKGLMDEARNKIKELLDLPNDDGIIFTSGASEANNLLIRGLLSKCKSKGKNHIITTNIEHPSVLTTVKDLDDKDFSAEKSILEVDAQGFIDLDELKGKIRESTCLVSVIHANNEIGTIQDIAEIAKICKAKKVHLHVDMTQYIGRYLVSIKRLGINSLSMSSHKFHGPKGVGLLWIDNREKLDAIITGGHQEGEYRAGTENVIGIYGMSLALHKTMSQIAEGGDKKIKDNIDFLRKTLEVELHGIVKFNGPKDEDKRLYNTISLCLVGVNSRHLLKKLDKKGIYINVASACQKTAKSHVMEAIGLDDKLSQGSVRISLGLQNTRADVENFLKEFIKMVKEAKFQKKYVM